MFRLAIISAFLAFAAGALVPASSHQKIVGGRNTSIEEVPYQAAIERQIHICGGVIISTRHILTAAHCFFNSDLRRVEVRTGSSHLESGGTTIKAINITYHPKYNTSSFDYDVAVIELKSDIELSDVAQIIQLAEEEPSEGVEGVISGWGDLGNGQEEPPTILQSITTAIVNRQKCEEAYVGFDTITDRMICGGGEGIGTCKGDSGGPLTVQGNSGNSVLVGISSFVKDVCATSGYYDVYTNVAHPEIRSFILEQAGL